ncbi:lipid-transfer protein, partial [Streptomyces sp. NPDC005921]
MTADVAVLGVGMHPWGKWGRGFVEYGTAAARAALEDAGLRWRDVGSIVGADTVRGGYPGYVAGATFAKALGWQGARVGAGSRMVVLAVGGCRGGGACRRSVAS